MTRIRLALLASLAAVPACSLDTTDRISQPPRLRVVNAASGTTGVNLHLNTNATGLLPAPLAFEEVTDGCLMILDGTHQLAFVQGTTTLASTTTTFKDNTSYVVLLVENAGTFKAVVAEDSETAPTGSNGLRLVNATSAAGDVYANAPGEAPSAATRVSGNLAPLATVTNPSLPYAFRSETATHVRLFDVGNTTTARSNLTLAGTGSRRLTTIVFTTPTFASDPAAIQVNACN